MIQTKLNTPNSSQEHLLQDTDIKSSKNTATVNGLVETNSTASNNTEPNSTTETKTYKYQGPPAINLSTWSERPKTKVSLKEDTDYRINNKDQVYLKNNFNVVMNCNSSVEKKHTSHTNDTVNHFKTESNVSIKINGSEPIATHEAGNVVIKIGEVQSSNVRCNPTYVSHTGYRKPLANINKITKTPRPHSIAFDGDFDISRVPIVRSVELKKSLRDNPSNFNKSITQINSFNTDISNNYQNDKYTDTYRSTEAINEINTLKPSQIKKTNVYLNSEVTNKPVIKVNSFIQNRSAPTVVGFKESKIHNDNLIENRKTWNISSSNTLPIKINQRHSVIANNLYQKPAAPSFNGSVKLTYETKVPFVCNNLKNSSNGNSFHNLNLVHNNNFMKSQSSDNTISINRVYANGFSTETKIVTPPPLPNANKKIFRDDANSNPRNDLLNSIRNFGGINGLKHI